MHWTVRDFKGLREASVRLEQGMLTVLTGANSSGKSSIIQSLLLVAQTGYQHGPVVLNGALTRLGEAGDLVRSDQASLAFEMQFSPGEDDSFLNDFDDGDLADIGELTVRLELVPTSDGGSLRLKSLRIASSNYPDLPLELSSANARGDDVESILKGKRGITDLLHLKSALGQSSRTLRTYVSFTGLRPMEVHRAQDEDDARELYKREYRTRLKQVVREFRQAERGASPRQLRDSYLFAYELVDQATSLSTSELPSSLAEAMKKRGRAQPLMRGLEALTKSDIDQIVAVMANLWVAQPVTSVKAHERVLAPESQVGSIHLGTLERALVNRMSLSIQALAAFAAQLQKFGNSVQYLGPLRDEPRVVWTQWNEQLRGLPVGARGELSAAVLARSSSRIIKYVDPNGDSRTDSLGDAVGVWINYLEIGESVQANSRGKLGVGLEVTVGGNARDLTSVGVGVSQALPLIVAFLTLDDDSIFLVEQPELHLHPAVQARLADFFLQARPRVAALIETHSEALVTRIRRRVAEHPPVSSRAQVVFVEDPTEGATTRILEVDSRGDLSDWPRGFMSGSLDDARAILRVNAARKDGR